MAAAYFSRMRISLCVCVWWRIAAYGRVWSRMRICRVCVCVAFAYVSRMRVSMRKAALLIDRNNLH
jgi:hypothetical protein